MNLLIDQGNTRIKVAKADGNTLKELFYFSDEKTVHEYLQKETFEKALFSTVKDNKNLWFNLLKSIPKVKCLEVGMQLPFRNLYKSLDTQGTDRIAAVAGATALYPGEPVLVLICGTCLLMEFKDEKEVYHGGLISPGLYMRFSALHQFTAKLPLIEPVLDDIPFPGNDTQSSILNGVIQGMRMEIEGYIRIYKNKYPHLRVILSGGDLRFFETTIKESIFVVPEIQLVGMNRILNDNV